MSGRRALIGDTRKRLIAAATRALEDHGREGWVSVAFVGDDEIRELHREFLGKDEATDTISFPLETSDDPTPDGLLGEVVVSVDTARREAGKRGSSVERELCLYAIHGVLHLLGYDDRDPPSRRRMRRAERRYLAR